MIQIPLQNRQSRTRVREAHAKMEDRKRIFPLRLNLTLVDSGEVISMQLADCLLVGRDSTPKTDVDLTHFNGVQYGISHMHAALLYDGHTLSVEDLNSRHGTRINGFRIEGGKPYPLHNGDELELGHMRLLVQLVRGAA
jgi:FHA domain